MLKGIFPLLGTFWVCTPRNHLNTAWLTEFWFALWSFCRFVFFPFLSVVNSFPLILTHIDKVFLGTKYFADMSLFLRPLLSLFNMESFSFKVLFTSLFFCVNNILPKKKARKIRLSNVFSLQKQDFQKETFGNENRPLILRPFNVFILQKLDALIKRGTVWCRSNTHRYTHNCQLLFLLIRLPIFFHLFLKSFT